MSKTRLRTLKRAWQVAMGGTDGIPRPHVRRLKKNWLSVCAGRGWITLLRIKPGLGVVATANMKMGSALGLARRGRGAVDEAWQLMKRQEELRKEGKA